MQAEAFFIETYGITNRPTFCFFYSLFWFKGDFLLPCIRVVSAALFIAAPFLVYVIGRIEGLKKSFALAGAVLVALACRPGTNLNASTYELAFLAAGTLVLLAEVREGGKLPVWRLLGAGALSASPSS